MSYLTNLEEELAGAEGVQARDRYVVELNNELAACKSRLRKGMDSQSFKKETAKSKALEAAIDVLQQLELSK